MYFLLIRNNLYCCIRQKCKKKVNTNFRGQMTCKYFDIFVKYSREKTGENSKVFMIIDEYHE